MRMDIIIALVASVFILSNTLKADELDHQSLANGSTIVITDPEDPASIIELPVLRDGLMNGAEQQINRSALLCAVIKN